MAVLTAAVASGCSGSDEPSRPSVPTLGTEAASGEVPPEPNEESSRPWRKDRYISVEEAIRRLQPHVDVPVVLPQDGSAGLPSLEGWVADPKHLTWGRVDGLRFGKLELRNDPLILLISYGLGSFDGCGGRDHALETNVLGQPALLRISSEGLWSELVWPVSATGWTGRYGLAGTFEGWQMIRLAESMDTASLEASQGQEGC